MKLLRVLISSQQEPLYYRDIMRFDVFLLRHP